MEERQEMASSARTLEEILTAVEQDDSLKQNMDPSSMTTAQERVPRESEDGAESQGQGSSMLGAMLSNPELISKLPSLMQAVKSLSEPMPKGTPHRPQSPEALLCALRPYLGERRRQAVDTMIRVSRLSTALRSLH